MVEADRCSVVWWKPRMGGAINHKRNSQTPRSKLFQLKNLVKHVSFMVNKTSGVDGFCTSDMKLMGAYGLMKLGELFDTPFDQRPPEVWEVPHQVLEEKKKWVIT